MFRRRTSTVFKQASGLWLRNVSTSWRENVCRLVPSADGADLEVTSCALRDGWLEACTAKGAIAFVFARSDLLLVRTQSPDMALRFEYQSPRRKYEFPTDFGRMVDYLHYNADRLLMDTRTGVRRMKDGNVVCVSPATNGIEVAILDIHTGDWNGAEVKDTFEDAVRRQASSFARTYAAMPSVPEEFKAARHDAAVLFWTAIAGPRGIFKRPMMLMSNNWMNKTWSWDRAINALSFGYKDQETAWNQFCCMFDFMSPEGMMPDMVSDEQVY